MKQEEGIPAGQKYVDERNQGGKNVQDGKILKMGSIQSKYKLLQLLLETSFLYGDKSLGIQHIISRQQRTCCEVRSAAMVYTVFVEIKKNKS